MGKEAPKRKSRKDIKIISIDLADRFPPEGDLQFLRAELPRGSYMYFLALVKYALYGYEPQTGLRLDLDKHAFIDHFENLPDVEKIAQRSASELSNYIASKLRKRG